MIARYKNNQNTYLKGYKIEIFPTEEQKEYFERCFSLTRYIYNWALNLENEQYRLYKEGLVEKKDKFLSAYTLHRKYTKLRNEKPFLQLISYEAARIIINDVIYAFESFWRFDNKYPKFKSNKRNSKCSLPVRSDRVYFENNMLRVEGLKRRTGKIFTKYYTYETKHDNIKYYNTRIVKDNIGKYWFCFKKEEIKPVAIHYFETNNIPISKPIGIDLNARPTIVISDGINEIVDDKPNIKKLNRRIAMQNRAISKDRERLKHQQQEQEKTNSAIELLPSNNAIKRLNEYRKSCKRRANITENFVQTATTKIIKSRPSAIVLETLSVREMESLHNVAASIRYSNIYKIQELLIQKANNYGIPIIKADKYYPSSQLCSICGSKNNIGSSKIFKCKYCGAVLDRDFNAACNLVKLAH